MVWFYLVLGILYGAGSFYAGARYGRKAEAAMQQIEREAGLAAAGVATAANEGVQAVKKAL
jgi:hypothetical protein